MLGNILTVITLICYGALANISLKPTPGGDYSVGYAFVWIFCAGGFFLFSGLLAWNMNLNHCFDWLPAPLAGRRALAVLLGWLALMLVIFWSLEYHSKWRAGEFPLYMRWFALSKVYFWLPILVFIPALYLINAERPADFAPNWVKIPWAIGFSVCLVLCLGIFYGLGKASVKRRIAFNEAAKSASNTGDWSFDTSMDEINNYSGESIQNLIIYTHREKDERLRKAAVAKIKTYADWEAQMIQILEKGELVDRYWVCAYMDGNEMAHPDSFIQPMVQNIELLVLEMKVSLSDPSSLYLGYTNVEALCRVLDTHFKDDAPAFRPSMEKLQQVFAANPPGRNDKTAKQWFDEKLAESRTALNNWLSRPTE